MNGLEKRGKLDSFFLGCGIVILYFILPILLTLPFALLLEKWEKANSHFLLSVIYLTIEVLTVVVFAYISRKDLKEDFKDFKKNYRKHLVLSVNIWKYGLIIMVVTNLIISRIIMKGNVANNEAINQTILNVFPLYAYPAIIILGPIIEELVFRLSFKRAFKNLLPFVLFTGILFGSIHVISSMNNAKDLLFLIPYSALGISFSLMYYRTKNIISNICIHVFHNTLSILLIIIANILR